MKLVRAKHSIILYGLGDVSINFYAAEERRGLWVGGIHVQDILSRGPRPREKTVRHIKVGGYWQTAPPRGWHNRWEWNGRGCLCLEASSWVGIKEGRSSERRSIKTFARLKIGLGGKAVAKENWDTFHSRAGADSERSPSGLDDVWRDSPANQDDSPY